MHGIYQLKEMLLRELEDIGEKGELTAGTLDTADKLAHTIKNMCKIIEDYEDEEYSSRGMSYEDGGMGGMSRARGGRGGRGGNRGRGGRTGANQYGSYADGYSRTGEMADRLEDLMHEAPDERTRQEIQRLITKMRSM